MASLSDGEWGGGRGGLEKLAAVGSALCILRCLLIKMWKASNNVSGSLRFISGPAGEWVLTRLSLFNTLVREGRSHCVTPPGSAGLADEIIPIVRLVHANGKQRVPSAAGVTTAHPTPFFKKQSFSWVRQVEDIYLVSSTLILLFKKFHLHLWVEKVKYNNVEISGNTSRSCISSSSHKKAF